MTQGRAPEAQEPQSPAPRGDEELHQLAPGRWRLLAPLIALTGGLFGILGAIYAEALHQSPLAAFVVAPIVEEAVKPAGVYLLLFKWPRVLRSRLYTAFLAGLGGIAFALIENLMYLYLYFPDHSPRLALWRYTACVALHGGASFTAGLGINEKLAAAVRGRIRFLAFDKRYFIAAMILHSLYNVLAAVFSARLGLSR